MSGPAVGRAFLCSMCPCSPTVGSFQGVALLSAKCFSSAPLRLSRGRGRMVLSFLVKISDQCVETGLFFAPNLTDWYHKLQPDRSRDRMCGREMDGDRALNTSQRDSNKKTKFAAAELDSQVCGRTSGLPFCHTHGALSLSLSLSFFLSLSLSLPLSISVSVSLFHSLSVCLSRPA